MSKIWRNIGVGLFGVLLLVSGPLAGNYDPYTMVGAMASNIVRVTFFTVALFVGDSEAPSDAEQVFAGLSTTQERIERYIEILNDELPVRQSETLTLVRAEPGPDDVYFYLQYDEQVTEEVFARTYYENVLAGRVLTRPTCGEPINMTGATRLVTRFLYADGSQVLEPGLDTQWEVESRLDECVDVARQ